MKRNTPVNDVLRSSRIVTVWQPLLVLLISATQACADPQVGPVVAETGTPTGFPRTTGLQLDTAQLRSVAGHAVVTGERLPLAAGSIGVLGVRASAVEIRDKSVAGIDGEGVLYALSAGKTWAVWPTAQASDSLLLTVVQPGDGASDQQPTYVEPVAPKAMVDVRYPVGRTRSSAVNKSWKVAIGGDLQEALNNAQPGDEIVLASGAMFTGNFVLPTKQNSGSDWIVVRAEAVGVAAGTRMTEDKAATSASIITPNQEPAILSAPGARRWRLVGFTIAHTPTNPTEINYGVVVFGHGDETTLASQPSEIVLDRMYIHGATNSQLRRCVAFNGRSLAIIDSFLAECHSKGFDTQGVGGWGGGGPFLIDNNRIEASGQAIMFGGADPRITGVLPSDITIRHNYLYKPLSWGHGVFTVKAAFELKNGKRVLFEGNVIENHWIDAQAGFAILFQTLADENTSWAWTTVQDVMVRNNIIKNSTGGADVLGRVAYNGGTMPTNPSSRIVFLNNLWQDVGKDPITGAAGRIFLLIADHHDVSILNNTITLIGSASHAMIFDGAPAFNTTIARNVFPNTEYGIFGSGFGIGTIALNGYLQGGVMVGNVLPAQLANEYPAGNFFPGVSDNSIAGASSADVCQAAKSWLSASSIPPSIGVDCTSLEQAVRNVVTPLR